LVSSGEALKIERSLPHGHVAAVLGTLRRLGLERIIARERGRERDLVVALVCQRLLRPGSKLSATRQFGLSTLGEELQVPGAAERLKTRFGIEQIVFVGDRGMVKQAGVETLRQHGFDWISALTAPQLQRLARDGHLQLSLFDERNLAEIDSPDFAGERLVV